MSNQYKTYYIWKINLFNLSAVWTLLNGWGVIKARTEKEAQSKVDRKMASGRFDGHCFVPALEGENPNEKPSID